MQPLPGALTVNIGDMAQIFSNDALYASEHRVLQSVHAVRYSRAFFFNPSAAALIAPRTDLAAADKVPHYRPISWLEFRSKRIAGAQRGGGLGPVTVCRGATNLRGALLALTSWAKRSAEKNLVCPNPPWLRR